MTSYSSLPACRTSSRSKKPSNYAKYIQQYHQQIIPRSTKKLKSQIQMSNDNQLSSTQQKNNKKTLSCLLSNGKKLSIQVVFTKVKAPKATPKPKQKIIEQKIGTEKKPKLEQNNLLSKFLFAFQQIEKNQKQVEVESVKNVTNSAELPINQTKKEPKELKKKQKDEDDKFSKYYEKMKKLDEKFLQISETLVFL